jgi:hypothetical protein
MPLVMQVEAFSRLVEVESSTLFDMPVEYYHLTSGRRKRRVDAHECSELLNRALKLSQAANSMLEVVIERPTPVPAVDGWQSAALSGVPLGAHPIGLVNIQTPASDFWGKQIHQTWACMPKT